MRTKTLLLAVPVILSLGLAACSKDSKQMAKVRAATAVTPAQQKAAYAKNEESIDKDIATLKSNNVNTVNKGFSVMRAFNDIVLMKPFVKDVGVVKSTLKSIITKSEAQIGLAKKLNDADKLAQAEETKAKAQNTLEKFN